MTIVESDSPLLQLVILWPLVTNVMVAIINAMIIIVFDTNTSSNCALWVTRFQFKILLNIAR
jgi:hypothetical protein